jgi:uncharacterized membrane protein
MTRREVLVAYAVTAVAFLSLDAMWLSTMASRLYRPALGHLMAAQPVIAPVVAFYALYIAGIVGFALAPALAARRVKIALRRGAALGLIAYGTYDLTNQATLRDWPTLLTLADLAWGTVATALAASAATALLLRWRARESG